MAGCGVSAAAPVGFGARVSSVEDVFPDADPDDGEEGFEEGGHGGGIGEELQVVVSFAAQRVSEPTKIPSGARAWAILESIVSRSSAEKCPTAPSQTMTS